MRASYIVVIAAVLAIPSAGYRAAGRTGRRQGRLRFEHHDDPAEPLPWGGGPMAVPMHSAILLAIRAR